MNTSHRRTFLGQLSLGGLGAGFFRFQTPFAFNTNDQEAPTNLIIDADTANEVDDLFAIAGALLAPRLEIIGLCSAQWHTQARAPRDSVGASQALNEEILSLMGKTHIPHPIGSNIPLVNTYRPQNSEAASFIIEQAMALPAGDKIHVAILGPATNLASAILLEPRIIPKVVAQYLGFWHDLESGTWSKREFNTSNDPNAVDVLLNTPGLEFHVMTASTSQHLIFEKTLVDRQLKGKGGIGDFLVERWENYDRFWKKEDPEKARWTMWDIALILALAAPSLATSTQVKSPYDNLERNIYAYTSIDETAMEHMYWKNFQQYFDK
ncbi:MAG: nucleoside hydrolase [Bacteroidota bacterium]